MTINISKLMDSTIFTFFFFAFLSTTRAFDPCPSKSDGSDLSIMHIYGKCSPFDSLKPTSSWTTTVFNMAAKDHRRLAHLSGEDIDKRITNMPVASGQVINTGNFVVRMRFGQPEPQPMFMVLDTSADVSWIPCDGCTGCSSTMFSRNASGAYLPLDCSAPECAQAHGFPCPKTGPPPHCVFNQSYGGDSSLLATLSQDWLQLDKNYIPSFFFGCISAVSGESIPPQGLLGLSRGPLSVLTQSGPTFFSSMFSYCLPSFKSPYFSGSLRFGPNGQPKMKKFTPLLTNPRRPSLYYVNLTGITIGEVKVPIAPKSLRLNPKTGGGTIIDSGTVITRFVPKAYNAIKKVFRNQTKGPFTSLGAFDTCFSLTHEYLPPTMTLHFTGLDIDLPVENTLIHSSTGNLACLAMTSAPKNVNSVLNVIANLQQQNLRILLDVGNLRVGIIREVCN